MSDFGGFYFIKKTKKKHGCAICGRNIDIGEGCYNFTGKFEGEFQNWYACRTCYILQDEFIHKNDCFCDPDFIQDVINDKCYGWECPICGMERDIFELDTKENTVELICAGSQSHKFIYQLFSLVLENKFLLKPQE